MQKIFSSLNLVTKKDYPDFWIYLKYEILDNFVLFDYLKCYLKIYYDSEVAILWEKMSKNEKKN